MAGKFEVYKDKAGEFRFRLKAGNGEVIATGEGYKSKAGDLMKEFAQRLGGKGGGRPDMAQGGGSDVKALPEVLKSVPEGVDAQL